MIRISILAFFLFTTLYGFRPVSSANAALTDTVRTDKTEYQGRILFGNPEKRKVLLGETFSARIELWPAFSLIHGNGKELLNKSIFDLFYVSKINKVHLNKNNQDVLVLDLLLTSLMVYKNLELHPLRFSGKTFLISLASLGAASDVTIEVPKEMVVLPSGFTRSSSSDLWWLLFLLLTVGVIYNTYRKRKAQRLELLRIKKEAEQELLDKKKYWSDLFDQADCRLDFEEIYANKEEWEPYILNRSLAIDTFFKTIDEHQYRKEWNALQMKEVEDAFNGLREKKVFEVDINAKRGDDKR